MARKRRRLSGWLNTTFDELPVGACFAFEKKTKHATRKKVDRQNAIMLPKSRPYKLDDLDTPVFPKPCAVTFGRRRKTRKR